jgi:hypothetical protein
MRAREVRVMGIGKALRLVAPRTPEKFENLSRHIDPRWIEGALAATGTATVRRRRLPAESVVWLVIGMALLRDRCIQEVADALGLVLPGRRGPSVASGAVVQARDRLGQEPLWWLFDRTASAWAHASADRHRWHGLALYGIDGTSLRAADSPSNREYFGGHRNGSARGDSGYPLVRLVGVMALRSHLLAAALFGPYRTAETDYAADLLELIPDRSLTIVDRGFLGAPTLVPLTSSGTQRHWLTRAKPSTHWRVLRELGRGEAIVELTVAAKTRRKYPSLPSTFQARAVPYQRRGFPPQFLLTSLLDADRFPSAGLVDLYHERWELELGYDEIKTEMLEREETLRSRSPEAVCQEIWGLLIAYNLVRLEMERIATEAGVEPTRISFVAALLRCTDEWLWSTYASPGAIPRHLLALRADIKRFILPPRRSERSYPRAVKIPRTQYPRKPAVQKPAN